MQSLHHGVRRITVAPDDGPAHRHVGSRESHRETRQGAVFTVLRAQRVVDAACGLYQRALCIERQQEVEPARVQGLARSARQAAFEQHRRQPAGVGAIHMRVRAKGRQRIGLRKHRLRHIGVQVQTAHDGQIRTHDCAHACQQLPLGVFHVFSHGGAMQVEVHRIHRSRTCQQRGQVLHDFVRDTLEGVARHMRAGVGAGPDRRQKFPSACLAVRDETADRDTLATVALQHYGAAHVGQPARAGGEGRPVGFAGGKGIGLVLEASNQDACQ